MLVGLKALLVVSCQAHQLSGAPNKPQASDSSLCASSREKESFCASRRKEWGKKGDG